MIESVGMLNVIVDMQLEGLLSGGGEEMLNRRSKEWLDNKRQQFKGNELMAKLEGNAVYFVEATGSTSQAIAKYLVDGVPKLSSNEQIREYIIHVGKTIPLATASDPIVAYLRGSISDYQVQYSLFDWSELRSLRQSGDRAKYATRIMFICRLYQVATQLADGYLSWLLQDASMVGEASLLDVKHVFSAVYNQVYLWANLCIGNLVLYSDGKKLETDENKHFKIEAASWDNSQNHQQPPSEKKPKKR